MRATAQPAINPATSVAARRRRRSRQALAAARLWPTVSNGGSVVQPPASTERASSAAASCMSGFARLDRSAVLASGLCKPRGRGSVLDYRFRAFYPREVAWRTALAVAGQHDGSVHGLALAAAGRAPSPVAWHPFCVRSSTRHLRRRRRMHRRVGGARHLPLVRVALTMRASFQVSSCYEKQNQQHLLKHR